MGDSQRKYKTKRKACDDCKRLNFIIKGAEKEYYCPINAPYFMTNCDKKVIRKEK